MQTTNGLADTACWLRHAEAESNRTRMQDEVRNFYTPKVLSPTHETHGVCLVFVHAHFTFSMHLSANDQLTPSAALQVLSNIPHNGVLVIVAVLHSACQHALRLGRSVALRGIFVALRFTRDMLSLPNDAGFQTNSLNLHIKST